MKTFVKLLLVLSLIFALSCSRTTEEKVIRALKRQDHFRLKILGVDIVDTIYAAQVVDTLYHDYNKLEELDKLIKTLDIKIDSTLKNDRGLSKEEINHIRDDLRNITREAENMREFTQHRIFRLEQIGAERFDGAISGYYALIKTEKDTFEVVLKKNFNMLSPRFMLEYEKKPRKIPQIERGSRTEKQRSNRGNEKALGEPADSGRGRNTQPSKAPNRIPLQ